MGEAYTATMETEEVDTGALIRLEVTVDKVRVYGPDEDPCRVGAEVERVIAHIHEEPMLWSPDDPLITTYDEFLALDEEVASVARRLADGPPIALAASKRLLQAGLGSSLSEALEAESNVQCVNFTTKDTAEAVSAFLEKREPRFTGR